MRISVSIQPSYVHTYCVPVPTKYVLVPWSVKLPGLRPRTLTTRDDNCSTSGREIKFSDEFNRPAAIYNQHFINLLSIFKLAQN